MGDEKAKKDTAPHPVSSFFLSVECLPFGLGVRACGSPLIIHAQRDIHFIFFIYFVLFYFFSPALDGWRRGKVGKVWGKE